MSKYLDMRLEGLTPYVPGEQPREKLIKLNTNESPYLPSVKVAEVVARQADNLNLYPDPDARELREALSCMLGVGAGNIFAGNGSDEILAFCFFAFCPNGAAFANITYRFYNVYAQLYNIDTEIVPLEKDFTLKPENYANLGKTIFIANPNAPTGIALTRKQIEEILLANRDNLVVIDEAYVHFGAETVVPLTESYDNLLVVGTFSKSRSLAGARLGYAVGSKSLIEDLNRIKFSFNPYNISRMAMAAGIHAALDTEYYNACITKIIATRTRSITELSKLGFESTESLANFIFTRHSKLCGETIYNRLRRYGILVRRWEQPLIGDYLRITVGNDAEMDALFAALSIIIGEAL